MIKQLTRDEKLEIIRIRGKSTDKLLRILLDLQEHSDRQYVDEDTALLVAQELEIPLSKVFDVLTFYSMLHMKPSARYIVEVCNNAPCHFNHSVAVLPILEKILDIKIGETTSDGFFALRHTTCVGACDRGPVMKIGETVYGHLNEDKIRHILDVLRTTDQSHTLEGN